jgi:hypothetical protein
MQSKAATVEAYLASLPEDRRAAVSAVREVILANMDKNLREGMQYGMIGYSIPHEVFGPGYHCDPRQPLPFAGLASQSGHMSLYLMCAYSHAPTRQWLEKSWKAAGKKLDMGKACIRFKKLDDVPLEVIGEVFRRVTAKSFIDVYVDLLASTGRGPDGKPLKTGGSGKPEGGTKPKPAPKKPAARTSTKKKLTAKKKTKKK